MEKTATESNDDKRHRLKFFQIKYHANEYTYIFFFLKCKCKWFLLYYTVFNDPWSTNHWVLVQGLVVPCLSLLITNTEMRHSTTAQSFHVKPTRCSCGSVWHHDSGSMEPSVVWSLCTYQQNAAVKVSWMSKINSIFWHFNGQFQVCKRILFDGWCGLSGWLIFSFYSNQSQTSALVGWVQGWCCKKSNQNMFITRTTYSDNI